jgi:putative colanic acid biosynthesis glycosyltransferase
MEENKSPKIINIMQINTGNIGGGAETVASNIQKQLLVSGHDSHLVVKRKSNYDNNVISMNYHLPEIAFFMGLEKILGLDNILYFRQRMLKRIIIDKKIDIIHLHNIHGYYFSLFNFPLVLKDIPIVWTLHDTWPFTGKCVYTYDCERYQTTCGNCKRLKEYPRMLWDNTRFMQSLKKKMYSKANNIVFVTPSRWLKEMAKKSSILRDYRIEHIPNGVDTSIFYPQVKEDLRKKYKIPLDMKCILFIANDVNEKRKGFRHLLNALERLEHKEEYTLLSIGRKQLDTKIKSDFKVMEFSNVEKESELAELYNVTDLFVIPSIEENFPCVINEAMACGVPVIGFDTGGIPEQIEDGLRGFCAKKGDIIDLAKKIGSFFNLPESLRREMAQNCYVHVTSNLTLKHCVDKYIALYKDILSETSFED